MWVFHMPAGVKGRYYMRARCDADWASGSGRMIAPNIFILNRRDPDSSARSLACSFSR